MNQNSVEVKTESRVLFIDMNSYFARCEQQANYWLRNRPVGVCIYTGKYGCVISLSTEAKARGLKAGMRLNDAMAACPDLVPVESILPATASIIPGSLTCCLPIVKMWLPKALTRLLSI